MPKIAILNGDLEGQTIQVNKTVVALGRRTDNDVALALDPRVSRYHARLTQHGAEFVLEDIGSANGTFLEQRRLHGPANLRPGDRFRMGRTWLTVMPDIIPTSQIRAQESVQFLADAEAPPATVESVLYSVRADAPTRVADSEVAVRRLEVIHRISTSLASTLDLSTVVDNILGSVMEVIAAERGFVMLVDRETGEFVPQAMRIRSGSRAPEAMKVSRNLLEYAIRERLAFNTADAMQDERFLDLDSVQGLHIRSALCAPLIHGQQALGAIFLDSTSVSHVFSEADVEMLMVIANQVVTALENARLYTDLRKAYEELQSAQEQLLRSERLSTIGSITASIAHDMANIVTPLKPLIEIGFRDADVDQELFDALTRQVDRLTAMVERITSFSRTAQLRFEPANVNEIIRKTMTLIRSDVAHAGVELIMELDEELPPVKGDPAQLDRVFLNLAINALEAMEDSEERALTIRTEHDEEEVTISFIDTGPGIPLAIQDRLFEPLFTTKQSGTGLGLPSCRRIVEEEHQGTIAVDSLEGAGSTFSVHLPLAGTPAVQTAAVLQPA